MNGPGGRLLSPPPRRGMTLVEVMVTMAIFAGLAVIIAAFARALIEHWRTSERRRVLYERAAGALDLITEDLASALGRQPEGGPRVRAEFVGDYDPQTGRQRLFFVRSFETGPERALTFSAGDGRPSELVFEPPSEEDGNGRKKPQLGPVDGDEYTGARSGDYRPLGGMAQVAYYLLEEERVVPLPVAEGEEPKKERIWVLQRAIRAPAEGPFSDLLRPDYCTPILEDVLFLGFEYWSPYTHDWGYVGPQDAVPLNRRKYGPERIWDSTRGRTQPPFSDFLRAAPPDERNVPESLNRPEDDIFPMMVRITLVLDTPMPRATHTFLSEDLGPHFGEVYVESTRGFPEGGREDSFLLIGNEWVRYKQKHADRFVVEDRKDRESRGARGTIPQDHARGALVRLGRAFRRVVFLPCYNDSLTRQQ